MPARDYLKTGHDDPSICQCSYHRYLRDLRTYQGPEPDSVPYDPEIYDYETYRR